MVNGYRLMGITRKQLSLILRAAAGLLLLALLIAWIGIDSLKDTLTAFHPLYYGAALALLGLHFLFQSLILRTLLVGKGILVRARHVFRLTLISNFFGMFLPGGIGPDMVLCYNVVRSTEKKEVAFSAIIFSRISVLFLMALTAFGVSFHPLAARAEIQWLTGLVVLSFLAYWFVMANRNTLALARRLLDFLNRHRLTSVLYKVYFALSDYGRDRRSVLQIAPFLIGSALIKIVTDYVIALSLGFDIPLLYFFVFIPLITIISALPLTFAGLGVREGSFVGLFALAGVPAEQAIAVSLVSFTLVIIIAAIGAVLYVLHGATLVTQAPDTASRSSALH